MPELSYRDELRDAVKRELDALVSQFAQPFNWIDVPYSADFFSSSDGMWTVSEGNIVHFAYMMLSPSVMLITFRIANTTTPGTPSDLRIRIPGGYRNGPQVIATVGYAANAGTPVAMRIFADGDADFLRLQPLAAGTWAAGTVNVQGQIWMRVSAQIVA